MKLKWEDKSIQTPLSRARGLGSARDGSTHWLHQRVTAIANLILMPWLIWSVVNMQGWTHADVSAWLQNPINAILMILATISVFYHAALGCQVVVEDYIHNEGFKFAKLIGMKLFFTACAVACVFSIVKIALG